VRWRSHQLCPGVLGRPRGVTGSSMLARRWAKAACSAAVGLSALRATGHPGVDCNVDPEAPHGRRSTEASRRRGNGMGSITFTKSAVFKFQSCNDTPLGTQRLRFTGDRLNASVGLLRPMAKNIHVSSCAWDVSKTTISAQNRGRSRFTFLRDFVSSIYVGGCGALLKSSGMAGVHGRKCVFQTA